MNEPKSKTPKTDRFAKLIFAVKDDLGPEALRFLVREADACERRELETRLIKSPTEWAG